MDHPQKSWIRTPWFGTLCLIGGTVALGIQAYNVVYYQTLVSAYLGGGVALLVIGAMATLHEIDDRRTELCSRNCVFPDSQAADDTLQAPPRTAADPSPDEYDQRFRDL